VIGYGLDEDRGLVTGASLQPAATLRVDGDPAVIVTKQERSALHVRVAGFGTPVLTSWVERLPPRLRRFLPRQLVGFGLLGGFTFVVDLVLLATLRAWTTLPLPVAVTIAYAAAFGLNFVLNRTSTSARTRRYVGRRSVTPSSCRPTSRSPSA
jgi:hypothetical protein